MGGTKNHDGNRNVHSNKQVHLNPYLISHVRVMFCSTPGSRYDALSAPTRLNCHLPCVGKRGLEVLSPGYTSWHAEDTVPMRILEPPEGSFVRT